MFTNRNKKLSTNSEDHQIKTPAGFKLQMIRLQFSPAGSDGKESAHNSGDQNSIPGLGRSPGEGHGNPLQYSCLENPMDRVAQGATSWDCKEWEMTERLSLLR